MWAEAHAEVGISPHTSPRVDCLRFLSPRANRPRKFHTATLSYAFQSVSISRTLNTPDSGVFFSSTRPMSGTVQQSPDRRQGTSILELETGGSTARVKKHRLVCRGPRRTEKQDQCQPKGPVHPLLTPVTGSR